MADLAASAVTIERSWIVQTTTGKIRCRQVTLVLSGQGSTTNLIPASALELTKIEECTNFVQSDDAKIYPAVPNYAGTAILLDALTQVTDANRANPADITSVTVRGIVKGY